MDEDSDFDAGFYGEKFARFDGLGEDSVARLLGTAGIVPQDRDAALVWLGRKAKEKSREVRFRANIALAISAIALVVAIISCAVAIMVALR